MNLKLIALGGLVFYAMTWVVSMVTGPLIHEGVLAETYAATASFWRPELMQVPPDMVSLLPRWITTGLALSFVVAAIYGIVRPAIGGQGWTRGAKYGFGVGVLANAALATMSGVFNLPDVIWFWWIVEGLVVYTLGGAVLGWVGDRWCAAPAR
jgi:hypothetical protein